MKLWMQTVQAVGPAPVQFMDVIPREEGLGLGISSPTQDSVFSLP